MYVSEFHFVAPLFKGSTTCISGFVRNIFGAKLSGLVSSEQQVEVSHLHAEKTCRNGFN